MKESIIDSNHVSKFKSINQKEIFKMEEKITNIKKDLMYKWYNAEPAQKKNIFEQLTKDSKPKK